MVSLDKICRLAMASSFDSHGPSPLPSDPEKVKVLGAASRHDICTSSSCGSPGICHSFTRDGRCISLFKTLYTNACSHGCNYCTSASTCTSGPKAYSYTPEELAGLTLSLYRSNRVEGLFLSSGIGGDADSAMDGMIKAARLLRESPEFRGYIHLKILPGASFERVKMAVEVSDRVSINIEAATSEGMNEICPTKDYQNDILLRQRWVKAISSKMELPAGQTTQMVVGAGDESDLDIFQRAEKEYGEMGVRRVYFSAFSPQKGTVFRSRPAQPLWREHRLYQVDWLARVYKFSRDEIALAFDDDGLLPDSDPKEKVARSLLDSPVDPNAASYADLIRVPGIGPGTARKIIARRRDGKILTNSEIASLGGRVRRAAPFLKINGWRDSTLEMFS